MFRPVIVITAFLVVMTLQQSETMDYYFANSMENIYATADSCKFYESLLEGIHNEKSFDTILLIVYQTWHKQHNNYKEWQIFFRYQISSLPRVIMTPDQSFLYADYFNSNILTVLMIDLEDKNTMNKDIAMDTLANSLDYMRQSRILIVALELTNNSKDFKHFLLIKCEKYKMTNVILSIRNRNLNTVSQNQYYLLKPYPLYHWQDEILQGHKDNEFFPSHWLDMKNKTVITFPEQSPPNTIVFKDPQGQIHLSGYIAHLVMLFAEHYNAHLHMYQPLEVGNAIHFKANAKLVEEGFLDIPMSTNFEKSWRNISDVVELNYLAIMVPLAPQYTIGEVLPLLLNGYLFQLIIIITVILSLLHTFIDYMFEGAWKYLHCLINPYVLPGMLGQSFAIAPRLKHLRGVHIISLHIGLCGLFICTLFSADVQSRFTSPPFHGQISNLSDLQHTPIQLLVEQTDAIFMKSWVERHKNIITITGNRTLFLNLRQNFNISYAYLVQTGIWNIYNWRQQYFGRNVFHTPEAMKLETLLIWGLHLQHNSPYKEPLNRLIHIAHDTGLINAWQAKTYRDMSNLKLVPLIDPTPERNSRILKTYDLLWLWILMASSWLISLLVFLLELLWLAHSTPIEFHINQSRPTITYLAVNSMNEKSFDTILLMVSQSSHNHYKEWQIFFKYQTPSLPRTITAIAINPQTTQTVNIYIA
ncbi:uncharacterized protein LOC142224469 [Haematobia irritans]|uniref:uncharacterized protein LOC142224469 n=1 Tax=Haematobia irritans TaxID=7368 RepID=UPI003F504E6A